MPTHHFFFLHGSLRGLAKCRKHHRVGLRNGVVRKFGGLRLGCRNWFDYVGIGVVTFGVGMGVFACTDTYLGGV